MPFTSLLNPAISTAEAAATLDSGRASVVFVDAGIGNDTLFAGLVQSAPKKTIGAALAALPDGGTIRIARGTYAITSGLTFDTAKYTVIGEPSVPSSLGTIIDASAMTSGFAVTLDAATAVSPYFANRTIMQDVQIVGNGGTGAGNRTSAVTGLRVHSGLAGNEYAISHANLINVNVHHFGVGIELGSHAYNLNFINADVWECGTAVYAPSGTSDSGERLAFIGSTIFNSDLGIHAANSSGRIDLLNTSVDYCLTWFKAENSTIVAVGGHLERPVTDSDIPIITTGVSGAVHISNARMVFTGVYNAGTAPVVVIQNDNTGAQYGARSTFKNIEMYSVRTGSGAFANGAGITELDISTNGTTNPVIEALNLSQSITADGGFESTVSGGALVDYVSITKDTSITSPVASTNLSVASTTAAPRSGTRHLRITKSTSNATATQVDILIPVPRRGAIPFVRCYIAKPGAGLVGDMSTPIMAVMVKPSGVVGVPTIAKEQQVSSSSNGRTLTSSALGYTLVTIGTQHQRMPLWATHVAIRFFLAANMTAGDLDVDDLYVDFV